MWGIFQHVNAHVSTCYVYIITQKSGMGERMSLTVLAKFWDFQVRILFSSILFGIFVCFVCTFLFIGIYHFYVLFVLLVHLVFLILYFKLLDYTFWNR